MAFRALEQVIADYKHEADVLRRQGFAPDADRLERVLREIENAAVDYLKRLSEDDAIFRSGRSRAWLRSNFPKWMAMGHAGFYDDRPRARWYRQLILPLRANRDAARDAGRRGERYGT